MIKESRKRALAKRAADFLEKASVASFAVGIFQLNLTGLIIGIVTCFLAFFITYKES